MSKELRGLTRDIATERDTRSGFEKFNSKLNKKKVSIVPIGAAIACCTPLLQAHAETILLTALPLTHLFTSRKVTVPFEKPYYDQRKGKGYFFFGNEIGTNKEVWFSDSEARRHVLIFGTTGSGKSESLIGIVANSLAQNSAFCYVDGKADTGLFSKLFSLCRRFGREDDILVINYMVGTTRTDIRREKKLSNTLNPFANATPDALSELITSLLPSGGSSDGIWKDRASVFMGALIKALCALRDEGHILLDVNIIRQYFTLEQIVALSKDTRIKESYREGLINYVSNLPGYQEGKSEQESTVYEQNGYVIMQFQPCFGMLADTYGHVMKTQLASVSFVDVVLRRRCLICLLPALEKSPANLSNLGKIIISSVKSMMAGALGAELEGLTEYTLDAKPTNGRTYQCVFDEYGYYSVEGAAVMPAQARGIGFSLTFAGQDYQAFKKGSADEAASIKANCAIKICMTLEDPTETAEIFIKGAGEGIRVAETGYEREKGMFGSRYISKRDVSFEKANRINERDLKDQYPGEYHIINMDNMCRGTSFYANPKQLKELRVNSFVEVKPPTATEISKVKNAIHSLNIKMSESGETVTDWKQKKSTEEGNIFKLLKGIDTTDELKRAFFAISATKNKIDIVNEMLVVRIKELEEHLNRPLPKSEKFNEEVTYSPDAKNTTSESSEVKKTGIRLLQERMSDNNKAIVTPTNWRLSPLLQLEIDVDDINNKVKSSSEGILSRWQSSGVLDIQSLYLDLDNQAIVSEIANQEVVIRSNELYDDYKSQVPSSVTDNATKNLDNLLESLSMNTGEIE
ncbi:putative enzyme [Vibrio chagasii]|nr:putative enzyme [Vibrio chagasii]